MLIHIDIFAISFLLLVAAFFSASEAALLSLNRSQLEGLRTQTPNQYRLIRNLIFRPEQLLSTVIIGNECINILLSEKITHWVELKFPAWEFGYRVFTSVFISSLLLLTFSEIIPKIFGFRLNKKLAPFLVIPLNLAHRILTPIRNLFIRISHMVVNIMGFQNMYPTAIDEKDFLYLVEEGTQSGSLDKEERELILNVFNFSDLKVSQVMSPWEKVFHVRNNLSLAELLEKLKTVTFSRIPVLEENSSQVLGILHTKELFPLLLKQETNIQIKNLNDLVFPLFVVTSHMKISKLFREFKKKKMHMALVVDEYGKSVGIVTLEDVLSSLFKTK